MIGSFLLLAVCQSHHFRRHEVMLENLFRMDAFTRVQAHNLIEQVDELGVAHPFVATVIEAFFEVSEKITQPLPEQLRLLGHDLGVVAPRHPKQAHIDATVAVERLHSTLQTEPQGEARQHFK